MITIKAISHCMIAVGAGTILAMAWIQIMNAYANFIGDKQDAERCD